MTQIQRNLRRLLAIKRTYWESSRKYRPGLDASRMDRRYVKRISIPVLSIKRRERVGFALGKSYTTVGDIYQLTLTRKAAFYNAAPHLLNIVEQIDSELGREAMPWKVAVKKIDEILINLGCQLFVDECRLFTYVFAPTDWQRKRNGID